MKIRYNIKKFEYKVGYPLSNEFLNSGKGLFWRNDKKIFQKFSSFIEDREIKELKVINNIPMAYITGTGQIWVTLASLKKWEDEN